jgi:hypothetical protein
MRKSNIKTEAVIFNTVISIISSLFAIAFIPFMAVAKSFKLVFQTEKKLTGELAPLNAIDKSTLKIADYLSSTVSFFVGFLIVPFKAIGKLFAKTEIEVAAEPNKNLY